MDWDALRLSLQVGLTATAFSVVVGVPLAWWIARLRPGWRETASALVLVPLVLPPTVLGYYLLQAVGRRSFIGAALEDAFGFSFVFDWTGAVLAAFVVSVPFLVRPVHAGLPVLLSQACPARRGCYSALSTAPMRKRGRQPMHMPQRALPGQRCFSSTTNRQAPLPPTFQKKTNYSSV